MTFYSVGYWCDRVTIIHPSNNIKIVWLSSGTFSCIKNVSHLQYMCKTIAYGGLQHLAKETRCNLKSSSIPYWNYQALSFCLANLWPILRKKKSKCEGKCLYNWKILGLLLCQDRKSCLVIRYTFSLFKPLFLFSKF